MALLAAAITPALALGPAAVASARPAALAATDQAPIRYSTHSVAYVPAGYAAGAVNAEVAGMSSSGIIAANTYVSSPSEPIASYLVSPYGRVTLLTTPRGAGCHTKVADVNASGVAVGRMTCLQGTTPKTSLVQWKDPNSPVVLPGTFVDPQEIGDGGDILGRLWASPSGEPGRPALRTRDGVVLVGDDASAPTDVDATGTVVGKVATDAGFRAGGARMAPSLMALPRAPRVSGITDISPAGLHGVGYVENADGLLQPSFFAEDGTPSPMAGVPAGLTYSPLAVTDGGTVVLTRREVGEAPTVALWSRGVLRDAVVDDGSLPAGPTSFVDADRNLSVAAVVYSGGRMWPYRLVRVG